MISECLEHEFPSSEARRHLREYPGQTERGKTVAASPSGLVERRVAVEPVLAQAEALHPLQVIHTRLVETFIPARSPGGGEHRADHEHGIAHLIVPGMLTPALRGDRDPLFHS